MARDLDAAFPAVVESHIDGIFSGIRRMAPTHADAEDLTQETFLRAYRALSGYGSDRIAALDLRPWLWTIAINLCRSAARRRSRRVTEVDLTATLHSTRSLGTTTTFDTTAAAALDTAMEAAWQRRLESLPATQRTAVVLRHVVDLPYVEIAAITQRPVGTVKADVNRGIARLRKTLAAERASQEEAAT
jgi:RNA polymerase sigma-70 factor (ECF subfamily)